MELGRRISVAREKNKCSKESEQGSGKACMKFMKDAWVEYNRKLEQENKDV